MGWITDPNIWAALLTLTALEIVLGIDNIIFISIVTGGLPAARALPTSGSYPLNTNLDYDENLAYTRWC